MLNTPTASRKHSITARLKVCLVLANVEITVLNWTGLRRIHSIHCFI